MSKKSGIITIWGSENYGAILQAYALQTVLSDLGVENEIIRFNDSGYYRYIHRGMLFRQFLSMLRTSLRSWLVGTTRGERTACFRRDRMKLSEDFYGENGKSLQDTLSIYDNFIVGSDQVWRPGFLDFGSDYLLAFVDGTHKKIAYAPSFGVANIPEKYHPIYKKHLSLFDAVSVREKNAVSLVEQLCGFTPSHVLDPTLLLDRSQWDNVTVAPKIKTPYILCYFMPGNKANDQLMTKTANHISRLAKLPVVWLGAKEYLALLPWYRSVFDAGPQEFLGWMRNASYIVTNSFHGTCFSMNFQVPFLSIVTSHNKNMNLTSRISSLLEITGLEERGVGVETKLPALNELNMDFSNSTEKLKQQREKSMQYLKNALEN